MLLSCQETHQLLNGLFNSSCWSFAEWSISLLLVKSIICLCLKFCSYHHYSPSPGQVPTCPCIHTHSHAHTCVYAKLQKDRKQVRVGSCIHKLSEIPVWPPKELSHFEDLNLSSSGAVLFWLMNLQDFLNVNQNIFFGVLCFFFF